MSIKFDNPQLNNTGRSGGSQGTSTRIKLQATRSHLQILDPNTININNNNEENGMTEHELKTKHNTQNEIDQRKTVTETKKENPRKLPEKNPNEGKMRCWCVLYCIGNFFLSCFDFLTYLIVPLCRLSFHAILVACEVCCSVCTKLDIETPDNFTEVPSREDDILAYAMEEKIFGKSSGQCFAMLTMCMARYCCCACILWEHCVLMFQVAYRKARDKFNMGDPDDEGKPIQREGTPINQVAIYHQDQVQGQIQVSQVQDGSNEINLQVRSQNILAVKVDKYRRIGFNDLPSKIIIG